ncbi:zinc transporter 1 isoform X2 [Xenopus laevis]|uniref:Zinc transporter 1 isoform X2 n=1 Tax=Xenopus laevis TaxID=8355 RepID=A0A8J1LGW0_XENLA|nr:zinc transporter 1 isoform X2 [Xenopus laevis]
MMEGGERAEQLKETLRREGKELGEGRMKAQQEREGQSFSLALGSMGRFVHPHHPHRPVLIFAAGVLGLGFNAIFIAATGTWQETGSKLTGGTKRRWLLILRLLSFLTPSSLLLASSLSLHLTDKDSPVLHYMDPALCLVSVAILITSVYSSMVENACILLQAVPPCFDLCGLKKDLEILCGPEGHHELHVWALAPGNGVASLHINCSGPEAYQVFLEQAQLLFKRHGISLITVQPEFGAHGPCRLACGLSCTQHLCCESQVLKAKVLVPTNPCP